MGVSILMLRSGWRWHFSQRGWKPGRGDPTHPQPIEHAREDIDVWSYSVEPYVVAADVYRLPGRIGQGDGAGIRVRSLDVPGVDRRDAWFEEACCR